MPNNYTPRRAAPDREPERRRSSSPAPRETRYSQERRAPRETGYTSQTRHSRSSSEGYTRTPGYTAEDLTPRAPRNTAPRTSRETRPMRETRRETSTYVRRSVPSRRRRKKQPPILPILLLLVIVVLAVVIFFVVRGCSSQPAQGGGTPNSSQSSAVSGETSGAASGTPESNASGAAATPTPAPSEEPTPAPQEDPDAAPETVGGLLSVGDTAYEYYNFKEEYANQYITAVADAGEKLNGIATVYDMVIPTSIDIDLPESYIDRNQLNTSDQRQAIEDYIYPSINAMNSSVKTVSVFDALKSHANEYLYFRTDHHWTQLGAYYAYVEFCKVRGFEPVALDQFDMDTDTPDMAKLAPAHEGRLPVWVEGNAYLGGAKACKNEINGLVNGEQPVQVEVELENGRPVLSTNVYELLEGFTGRRIDTQVLGKAFEPEEYFENPDGTPITFDQDYFGDHRGAHPLPGPFAGKDAVGQPLW